MAHVVTERCIKCKYTDCVTSCPVFCFHEGANMLVIDPDECIDCRACIDKCPVQAIYPDGELPVKWIPYLRLNRELAREWPLISFPKAALPEAEAYHDVREKWAYLDRAPGDGDPNV